MLSRKLLNFLESFSRPERYSFQKFLASPFFNESQDLIRLFDLILATMKESEANGKKKELTKQAVWQLLFPTKTYSDVHMRRLSSDLNLLAQQYMAYNTFKNTPLGEQTHLLEALNTPQLNKHFVGAVRQARKIQQKTKLCNADAHFDSHLIEYRCHLHLDQLGYKRDDFENLEKSDYHLDCFYISKKLKVYCEAMDYKHRFMVSPSVLLPPDFMNYVEQSVYFKEPSVKVYYLAIKMMNSPQEEVYFQKLKSFVHLHLDGFPPTELKFLYTLLMNYCITTKINNGRAEYYTELFSLYETSLDRQLIFEKGFLTPNHYKNILTIALHIKEFEWAENFIQTYTTQLPKENQENALNYNMAKLYFHQEDYPKVIEQLREVEYKDLQYALGGKLMLLKTYYELEEDTALDSLIDSFRIYLRRNTRISRDVKQQYLNVLRFTKRLSTIADFDKAALLKVKEQIDGCKALAAKQWLLDKVGEVV